MDDTKRNELVVQISKKITQDETSIDEQDPRIINKYVDFIQLEIVRSSTHWSRCKQRQPHQRQRGTAARRATSSKQQLLTTNPTPHTLNLNLNSSSSSTLKLSAVLLAAARLREERLGGRARDVRSHSPCFVSGHHSPQTQGK